MVESLNTIQEFKSTSTRDNIVARSLKIVKNVSVKGNFKSVLKYIYSGAGFQRFKMEARVFLEPRDANSCPIEASSLQ